MLQNYGSWFLLVLTCGLVLCTMAISLAGLRKDYRDSSGRLSRAGRILLAFTLLVGLLTMTTAWMQEVLVSEKERRQDEENSSRFNAQISRLEALGATLSSVHRQSQSIVETQGSLMNRTEATLAQSARNNAQATQNAGVVLGRIFEEGHRIDPSRAEIEVDLECRLPNGAAPPLSFDRATITFLDAADIERGRVHFQGSGRQLHFSSAEMENLQFLPDLLNLKVRFRFQIGTGSMNLGQSIRHNSAANIDDLMGRCPFEVRIRVNDREAASSRGSLWERTVHQYAWDIPDAQINSSVLPQQ